MVTEYQSLKDFLKDEFETRVKKNSRYSLRSFAQFLGINPAEISQVFHGKRNLSMTSALKMSNALGLTANEKKHILWLLQSEKGRKTGLDLNFVEPRSTQEIELEQFAKISNWYHFAIINMIDTKDFIWSAREISKRIGIGVSEAQVAMNELLQSGLVTIEERQKRVFATAVEVKSDLPSHIIRKYHSQMLEKAMMSLDETAVDLREFQSIGFVLDPQKIELLKKEIRQFSKMIVNKYHKVSGKEVYQIEVCLFPITKGNIK